MLCATAAALAWTLAVERFELVWTHSVERIEWSERWRVTPGDLQLERAAIRGSGAGMEPDPSARLEDGAWVWHPDRPPQPALTLARSGAVPDWRFCAAGSCAGLEAWLPGLPPGEAVTLRPCDAASLAMPGGDL